MNYSTTELTRGDSPCPDLVGRDAGRDEAAVDEVRLAFAAVEESIEVALTRRPPEEKRVAARTSPTFRNPSSSPFGDGK
jgi:hypothetical protein